MKLRSILILLVPLFIACGQAEQDTTASTESPMQNSVVESEADCHDGEACNEVALFSVDGLDMAMAGQLAKALTDLPGVLSAKPAVADGKFAVEFTNPTSTPKVILEALTSAGASATLLDVSPAVASDGAKSGCAGCPSQSKCKGSSS